jgi:HEAT repeat protein
MSRGIEHRTHIFISFARKDARYAERVDQDLAALGYRTWRDTRDKEPSTDLTGEIEWAIREASHVIVCLSPDIERRPESFVRREIQYALGRDKQRRRENPPRRLPLIPVVFPGGELPVSISTWDAIYLEREADYSRCFQELLVRLSTAPPPAEEASYADPPELVEYLRFLHDWASRTLEERVHTMLTLSALDTPHAVSGKSSGQFLLRFAVSPVLAGTRRAPPATAETSFASFPQAFQHHGGRVLLLGAPGAGKTTTLLAFARDAAVARLSDPTRPIPVLASIPTWDCRTPLSSWARAQVLGQRLPLEKHRLLYLLDGLDELGGNRPRDPRQLEGETFDPRALFLQALKEQLSGESLVLTSRVTDYEQLGEKAALPGAVTLQPLTDAQIQEYLVARGQPELWSVLQSDAALKDLMRTPLLLALLAFACAPLAFACAPETGQFLPDRSGLDENRLFDLYIHRRFEHETARLEQMPFDEPRTRELLGELAAEMRLGWILRQLAPDLEPGVASHLERCREDFLRFGQRMHFLQKAADGSVQFIHLKLRDFCGRPKALELLLAAPPSATAHISGWLREMGRMALPELFRALRSGREHVRHHVISALVRMEDPATVPGLIIALGDQEKSIRRSAEQELRTLDARAVPALIQELRGESRESRDAACAALSLLADSAVPALLEASGDADSDVRARAAGLLGQARAPAAVGALRASLGDAVGTVRAAAAHALGALGCDAAVPGLISALRDEDRHVRARAAEALGSLAAVRALPELSALLRDHDTQIRLAATWALGQMNTGDAIEGLLRALRDVAPEVRKYAAQGLVRSGGDPRAAPGVRAAFRDESADVRWAVVRELELHPEATYLPALLEALHDGYAPVREYAVYALQKLGDRAAVPALRETLHDDSAFVRGAALEALGRIDGSSTAG